MRIKKLNFAHNKPTTNHQIVIMIIIIIIGLTNENGIAIPINIRTKLVL